MTSNVFCENEKLTIQHLLSGELEKLIPNLDLKTLDKIVLELAYNDLKLYSDFEKNINNFSFDKRRKIKNIENKTTELKAFLKFWTGNWVEKWKKRIAISQRIPRICRAKVCKLRNARAFYYLSNCKKELKDNVIKKLIKRGEICMPQQISDQLIIREIAEHLNRKNFSVDDNLLYILHGVYTRIEKLQKETKPVLYLKLTKKQLDYKLR